ncbi:MAG: phosphoglucosamine mutase [Ruminococcaceae bacterium]|nr:phosphoglucosamine mutase [Oscillospiraceae bacterium]
MIMTIGEKISKLRQAAGISQEQLAEKISVSRQSVSKWEMDQAQPQIDKVLQLCELFDISTDTLLCDNKTINHKISGVPVRNKYFGTDGFRGEANQNLTSMHAYKVGRFLGWYYGSKLSGCEKAGYRPRIVIGKDTRRSSYMLEYSLVAGITASGADAYMLHVTTTPSVSYVTRQDEFDCGIMITASHNPYYDNGIKVINRYGEKLDDATTAYIEAYLDGDVNSLGVVGEDLPLAGRERIGCIVDYVSGRNRYVGYLISLASHSYKNMRIGLDCANGASWMIAKSVFGALGAQTVVVGADPNGLNVNENCGSTHIENLCRLVKEQHLDVGFAFDGDADRCIAVDENGTIVDGDKMLYILGKRLKDRGVLNHDTVVATVMTNSGLLSCLDKIGIKCVQTAVGDRFVYECMQNNDYCLGGEQSGHVILKKYATTGDGLLTALMLAEEMCDSKHSLSELTEPITLYPQYMENIRVKDKAAVLADPVVQESLQAVEALIDGKGRALLRQSGTEPVIRVMIESESEEKCKDYTKRIIKTIQERGHGVA